MRWQGGKDAKVVRWQGAKGGRVVKWQGGNSWFYSRVGGCRVSPRFHLFVSDVGQQSKRSSRASSRLSGMATGMERLSEDLKPAARSSGVRESLEFVISG